MPEYVIADASVLIIFDKIDRFEILKEVYQKIYTTPEIADEFNKPVPDWVIVESVKDKRYQKFIQTQVDIGEASVFSLFPPTFIHKLQKCWRTFQYYPTLTELPV